MSLSIKVFGFLLLFIVICLWVASSTAIQLLFTSGGFQKPFFLTYFSTSMFSLYLLTLPFKKLSMQELKKTEILALQFCPLWFGANYFFNLSLSMTSLSSSTIISSCAGVLTLLLAVFILKDSPDVLKFVASLLALGGVAMVAFNDQENSNSESAMGDILALCGAIVYASYSVFLKAKTETVDIVIFLGCVGATNLLVFSPGFLILDLTGFETFGFPSNIDWAVLCLNGLFGTVVSDLLWALSIRYLNPALCTVGISLTIPISFVVQSMIFSFRLTMLNVFGGLLVVCGFLIMASFEHSRLRNYVTNEGLKALLCRKKSADFDLDTLIDKSTPKNQ